MIYPYSHKCRKCGKEIFPTPQWIYKRGSKYYCSWTCYRKATVNKVKPKVILPQVGDTIRIIYISGIPGYSKKVGRVEFYDSMGQMHGTWGGWVVIPGEDIYEIVGEKNDGQNTNSNPTMVET